MYLQSFFHSGCDQFNFMNTDLGFFCIYKTQLHVDHRLHAPYVHILSTRALPSEASSGLIFAKVSKLVKFLQLFILYPYAKMLKLCDMMRHLETNSFYKFEGAEINSCSSRSWKWVFRGCGSRLVGIFYHCKLWNKTTKLSIQDLKVLFILLHKWKQYTM